MGLNEIFKGMSNAAEQINENFQSSTIVDSNETENEGYIRFGNGTQVCWGRSEVPTGATIATAGMFRSDNFQLDYPAPFKEGTVPAITPSIARGPVDFNFAWIAQHGREVLDGLHIKTPRMFMVRSTSSGNTRFIVTYVAFGIWK